MSDKDKEETSKAQDHKLLLEALTATMTKLMDERFEAQRLERDGVRSNRREQELNPKPPDNTLRSTRRSSQKISHTPKSKSASCSEYHQANELFKFSGKRSYLEWEENMDDWFYYNRIPKEKRIGHGIRQLTGDAYQWWIREVDDRWNYKEPPITSWKDLKKLMRKKYEPKVLVPKEAYSPQPKEVLKHVLHAEMEAKETPQPKKATEVHKQSLNPSLESSHQQLQCKSSNLPKSHEVTCYKCRKKGHFAATCHEKHKLYITSLASIPSSQNSSSEVVNQILENSNSCVMHLVLSKGVETGPTKKNTSKGEAMDQNLTQDTSQSMLLKELQPEHHLNHNISSVVKEIATTHSNPVVQAGEIKQTLLPKPPVLKFVYRETLLSFTNLAPALPSDTPCHFQDFKSVVPRKKSSDLLLPICDIESPIAFEKANIETNLCDIRNKRGKEIIVADAIIPRYAFLFIPENKLLELEHIRMLYDLNDNFKNVSPSCEEFVHKKFFRHRRFLFDKTCEPNINFVLMDMVNFSNSVSASLNTESFVGEIVYFDSTLNFGKHLDNLVFLSKDPFIHHHTDIIHLSLSKEPTKGFRAASKRTRRIQKREEDKRFKPPDLDHDKNAHEEESTVIFEHGYRFWIRMKEKHFLAQKEPKRTLKGDCSFQVKEQINAYKICLQGKYNMSPSFNVADLMPFIAGESDLRSNLFQEGGDDMIMDQELGTKEIEQQIEQQHDVPEHEDEHGALEIPLGPITRTKARKLKQAIGGMLKHLSMELEDGASQTILVSIQAE